MRLVAVSACLLWFGTGCGSVPPSVGIVVNRAGLTKTSLETAPDELARARAKALDRKTQADVMGDGRLETLAALPGGAGIEIRSEGGEPTVPIAAPAYLTDFGVVPSSRTLKQDVILYVYPADNGVGTFLLVNPRTGEELASWNEDPPPGRFVVAAWKKATAVFYTQRDSIVIRTPTGTLLKRLVSPGAERFRDLYVRHQPGDRLVIVASGNGYTPYHMVSVYDSAGDLVFHEIALEHAFGLDIDDARRSFVVTGRSGRWIYEPSSGAEERLPVIETPAPLQN